MTRGAQFDNLIERYQPGPVNTAGNCDYCGSGFIRFNQAGVVCSHCYRRKCADCQGIMLKSQSAQYLDGAGHMRHLSACGIHGLSGPQGEQVPVELRPWRLTTHTGRVGPSHETGYFDDAFGGKS